VIVAKSIKLKWIAEYKLNNYSEFFYLIYKIWSDCIHIFKKCNTYYNISKDIETTYDMITFIILKRQY
jgi:hypothetical protein